MATSTFKVTGLTCGHCVNSVKEEIGEIDGVNSVEVELVKGGESVVTVNSATELTAADVESAIKEAGDSYALVG